MAIDTCLEYLRVEHSTKLNMSVFDSASMKSSKWLNIHFSTHLE